MTYKGKINQRDFGGDVERTLVILGAPGLSLNASTGDGACGQVRDLLGGHCSAARRLARTPPLTGPERMPEIRMTDRAWSEDENACPCGIGDGNGEFAIETIGLDAPARGEVLVAMLSDAAFEQDGLYRYWS